MQTMGQRTKAIRQELEMSQEQFGQLFNSGKAYISLLENDKSKLSLDNLVKLSLNYDVNLNFLVNGIGEMFINTCENTHVMIKNERALKNFKHWGKRLSALLSENKETPYDFAKRTGIKESRVEKFILDSAEPTIAEINAIKSNVDISIDELLYGEKVIDNKINEDDLLSGINEFQNSNPDKHCTQYSDNYPLTVKQHFRKKTRVQLKNSDNWQKGEKNTQELSLSADEIVKLKEMLKNL